MSIQAPERVPVTDHLAAGVFLLVVAAPLIFTPFSAAPFADPKLLAVLAAGVLILASGAQIGRVLGLAAGAWTAIVLLAAVVGADVWWSLIGPPNQATGVLTLAVCAAAVTVGPAIDDSLHRRAAGWLFATGVAVSVVAVVSRFVDIGGATWELGNYTSLLGDRVFSGGFVAAAALAATMLPRRPLTYAGLLVIGSGLAVTAVRSAWIGVVVGLVLITWRSGWRWKTAAAVLLPVVVAIGAWTVGDRLIPEKEFALSAAPRFAELDEGSAQERVPVWRANLRSLPDDPLFGIGPGESWNTYLRSATDDEIRTASRSYGDAHNIFVELTVTTGLAGALALLALGAAILAGFRRAPPERAWAAGVTASLGIFHLLQPLNVVLTPLMFLTAGMSLAPPPLDRRTRLPRWLAVLGVAALVLGAARMTASSLERYGSTYASPQALRTAMRIEPHRVGAQRELANYLAFEAGAGDRRARAEALRTAREMVGDHPWHPAVRLDAANVAALVDDEDLARRYLDEQLRRFPRDPLAMAGIAVLALRAGDEAEAARYAQRALALDPALSLARSTLDAAQGR